MDYSEYPRNVVKDIARLRRRILASGIPDKKVDHNLIIGTWNIRSFGDLFSKWKENPSSPKRNLRALAYIAEIIRRFDVIAIQEVRRNTDALRCLMSDFLDEHWDFIYSDVTEGDKGNAERLTYIFDRRRVQTSGLAGEIVLPPGKEGNPVEQFDRTPYIVGFRSAGEHFSLLTAHIRYGEQESDRLNEIRSLAAYAAAEIRARAKSSKESSNLIVLGDFNIDQRGDNPLFQAFSSTGLVVPEQLLNIKTTYNTKPKFYDQIAWFMGDLDLLSNQKSGVIDFAGAVYQNLSLRQMSYRVSDHFPLWSEFIIDRSTEKMAQVLGLNPDLPDPLSVVAD